MEIACLMVTSDYQLIVNGEITPIGCMEFHHQDEPYPGGSRYVLTTKDADLIQYFLSRFSRGERKNLSGIDVSLVFNVIRLNLSLKCPQLKGGPIQFWANNILNLTISESCIVLAGDCSPNVD